MKYYVTVTNNEQDLPEWRLGKARRYLYESGSSFSAEQTLLTMNLAQQLAATVDDIPVPTSGNYWSVRSDSPSLSPYIEAANALYGNGDSPVVTNPPTTTQPTVARVGSTGDATSSSYQTDGPSYIA